jgi:hypothetical protein
MARAAQTDPDTETANVGVMERMTDILEQLQKNAPPNEPGFGHPEYQRRLREEGFFAEFAVPVWQNGKRAEARGLAPETIAHVTQLRPGVYLNGVVRVDVDSRGQVHLAYASASKSDRMKFAALIGSFDTLIARIWAEQHPATA